MIRIELITYWYSFSFSWRWWSQWKIEFQLTVSYRHPMDTREEKKKISNKIEPFTNECFMIVWQWRKKNIIKYCASAFPIKTSKRKMYKFSAWPNTWMVLMAFFFVFFLLYFLLFFLTNRYATVSIINASTNECKNTFSECYFECHEEQATENGLNQWTTTKYGKGQEMKRNKTKQKMAIIWKLKPNKSI